MDVARKDVDYECKLKTLEAQRQKESKSDWVRHNSNYMLCCRSTDLTLHYRYDKNAIVDGEFKARGIESLRVMDASSFPKIPGTYLVLPIYMISEKAADVILTSVT